MLEILYHNPAADLFRSVYRVTQGDASTEVVISRAAALALVEVGVHVRWVTDDLPEGYEEPVW